MSRAPSAEAIQVSPPPQIGASSPHTPSRRIHPHRNNLRCTPHQPHRLHPPREVRHANYFIKVTHKAREILGFLGVDQEVEVVAQEGIVVNPNGVSVALEGVGENTMDDRGDLLCRLEK